jgi:signal transduction histidine kinase
MTGKIRLDLYQISFAGVVQAAVDSAMPAADAKGIRLKAILGASQDIVSADGARLQQVVWNLLTNAIKFTPKRGQVQVLLQRVNSHLELSVSDTDVGIPASYLPHVFDRFSQKDSSATRASGGLGRVLLFAKLVELHGGSIRAASQGEGKGATFSVRLPLSIIQVEEESIPSIPRICHQIRHQELEFHGPEPTETAKSTVTPLYANWSMSRAATSFGMEAC